MATLPSYLQGPAVRPFYQGDLRQHIQGWTVPEPVRFDGLVFKGPVDFTGVAFENGAVFQRCIFEGPVNFRGARFKGQGRFWKCQFKGQADFRAAAFEQREPGGTGGYASQGEANFSWCRFEEPADFYGAKFRGPVFFWRTIFRKAAKLEASFDAEVTFEGNREQFCIDHSDFGTWCEDLKLLHDAAVLHKADFLSQDEDHPFCANLFLAYGDDALAAQLGKICLQPDLISRLKTVAAPWRTNMFSEQEASFRGCWFAKPEAVIFRNLDLKTCRFTNSNAGRAQFQNVQWDWRPTLFGAGGRSAVCDERPDGSKNPRATGGNRSPEALRALGALYFDLRSNYEGKGLFDEALDFHYGELETKRLSQPLPLRLFSLTAWYRYLSAYGTRPGLALFWLMVAVFIFFPLLFMLSGFSHDPLKAVLHSLETSTFLETPKSATEAVKDSVPVAAKFAAGFERIVVTFQAGLFLFAIQRKFGRK